jgi:hypothetical protein
MKLPRRNFLHLAAGAAALPAISRFAWALRGHARGRDGGVRKKLAAGLALLWQIFCVHGIPKSLFL